MESEKEGSKLGAGVPPRARLVVAGAWPLARASLLGARTLAREALPPVASLPKIRRVSNSDVDAERAKRTSPRSETRQRQAGVKVRLTTEERVLVEERRLPGDAVVAPRVRRRIDPYQLDRRKLCWRLVPLGHGAFTEETCPTGVSGMRWASVTHPVTAGLRVTLRSLDQP